ncbi:hypothetical protein CU100_07365 [Phyllobacterium endophyticum]|uniref:Uncharacterized protein n=1 Tax=Phyllobacterium endophyticum TaxID=1149773 RepID=A0A2P7B214_9HYPH|nr:hypothetical protein CU100_07365 [Phyllobacterium endophyticum]
MVAMIMVMADHMMPVMDRFSSACAGGKCGNRDREGNSEAESRIERSFHVLGFPWVGAEGRPADAGVKLSTHHLSDMDVSALFPAGGVSFLHCFRNEAAKGAHQALAGHERFTTGQRDFRAL